MNNFTKGIIIVLFIIGVLFCLIFIASGDLKGREASLIGIILSIFSILATWIVAHLYSESQHKKAIEEVQEFHRTNLQTYARKAAEKCNNLSNELSRLSAYIYDELDRSDIENINELILSREERMSSAIHIVTTLKSVNDTALSDWEGVIGEFLDKQREEKEEQVEEIRDLIERLQGLSETQYDSTRESHGHTEMLKRELNSLRREMRGIISSLGISNVQLRKPKRKIKEDILIPCIDCGNLLDYKQRPKTNSYKIVKCPSCNAQLISFYNQQQGFYLERRTDLTETFTCPECETTCTCSLNNLPTSAIDLTCETCKSELRVSRTIKKISVKRKGETTTKKVSIKVKDEDLQTVKNLLPEQPWPKGVNKTVAKKSGLSNSTVHKAIHELIKKGVFKPQIDGKLFVPEIMAGTDSK